MKTADLNSTKLELIRWISSLNDDAFLELINSFRISKTDKDWWNDLSEEQKTEIDLSLKELDEGKGISSKEFWNKHQ
jgi:hypothetical protein